MSLFFYSLPCNNRPEFNENRLFHPGQSCRGVCSSPDHAYILSILPRTVQNKALNRSDGELPLLLPPPITPLPVLKFRGVTTIRSVHFSSLRSLDFQQGQFCSLENITVISACFHKVTLDSSVIS